MAYKPVQARLFGLAIKHLLDARNLSQRKFAEKAGLKADYVSKLVNGKVAEPRQEQRRKIAKGLGVTEQQLQQLIAQYIENYQKPDGSVSCSDSEAIASSGNAPTNSSVTLVNPSTANISLPLPDSNFVGREDAIADLNIRASQGKKVILILAEGGMGKTTLAWQYLRSQGFDLLLELRMAKEAQNISSVESVIEEWLKRYFDEEPAREFGIALHRLRCKLRDESKKIGILIDNLEPALENGRFIEPHRRYVELLRMLNETEVQSFTLITSREQLHEDGILIELYRLKGLSKEAWNQFFVDWGINTGYSPLRYDSALDKMHKAYGGNAEAMFVISGAIHEEFQGYLEAYWKETNQDLLLNGELESLIKNQFNKLQNDDRERNAYKLLCRLGCYRYQDIPSIPEKGIFALLWDIKEDKQRRRVIKALTDRCLLKIYNKEYYLHPVMQAEAIERLRVSEDWKKANQEAANFWTQSIQSIETEEHAIRALEAYYHYLTIEEYNEAGHIIVRGRQNKWIQSLEGEYLGQSFFRLGLLAKISSVIAHILQEKAKINRDDLGKLYYILGSVCIITGNLIEAMNHFSISRKIAREITCKKLDIDTGITMGFCQKYIGDIDQAQKFFEEVLQIIDNDSYFSGDEVCCKCLLAFFYSSSNQEEVKKQAIKFAEEADAELSQVNHRTVFREGSSLVYLSSAYKNLGNFEKASKTYTNVIRFAEDANCMAIKAKALNGLAEIDRERQDFKSTILKHEEAKQITEKIGAKRDLAETYYQLGLTYKKMDELQESRKCFEKAIQLFGEMQVPMQVEKVRRAMENEE